MPATSYLRAKLGDHSIGKAAFTMPTTVYAALFTADPTDAGSLTNEVTGGSYARVPITTAMGAFSLTTGIATLTTDVNFPTPTANWGTVSYLALIDALTVGNMLYKEAIPLPRIIVSGGRAVRLKPGLFQIRLI